MVDQNLIVDEVAQILRCSRESARRLMASGEIESAKIAGRWIARASAVEAYQKALTEGRIPQRVRRRRRRRMA